MGFYFDTQSLCLKFDEQESVEPRGGSATVARAASRKHESRVGASDGPQVCGSR